LKNTFDFLKKEENKERIDIFIEKAKGRAYEKRGTLKK
jgi:hypothetical protein